MIDKANLGIFTFFPNKAAMDIANIGPNIQARGILKKSATIALGKEIINTSRNSLENNCLIFSRFNGIEFINSFF